MNQAEGSHLQKRYPRRDDPYLLQGRTLEQEIPYSGDKKNGEAKWYYPDGKLFRTRPMSMTQSMVNRYSTTRTGG
jgi:hypothetical protein